MEDDWSRKNSEPQREAQSVRIGYFTVMQGVLRLVVQQRYELCREDRPMTGHEICKALSMLHTEHLNHRETTRTPQTTLPMSGRSVCTPDGTWIMVYSRCKAKVGQVVIIVSLRCMGDG